MGDEGVGVQFIHHLDTNRISRKCKLLDGGTGGFTLVPYIESHPHVGYCRCYDGRKKKKVQLHF